MEERYYLVQRNRERNKYKGHGIGHCSQGQIKDHVGILDSRITTRRALKSYSLIGNKSRTQKYVCLLLRIKLLKNSNSFALAFTGFHKTKYSMKIPTCLSKSYGCHSWIRHQIPYRCPFISITIIYYYLFIYLFLLLLINSYIFSYQC